MPGARGFGGTIRENIFYFLLMNDMHDTIFFFLVYFVGVTQRVGAGVGELDSFSRLCSLNPLQSRGLLKSLLPDFQCKCKIALRLTPVMWHSLILFFPILSHLVYFVKYGLTGLLIQERHSQSVNMLAQELCLQKDSCCLFLTWFVAPDAGQQMSRGLS